MKSQTVSRCLALACLFSVIFINHSFAAGTMTLAETMNPSHYLKRDQPVLNVGLVYYGNERSLDELARIQVLLEKRFELATQGLIKIKTVFTEKINYRHRIENYPEYQLPNITDPARLQRLWYYDHIGAKVIEEAYEETKKQPHLKPQFKTLDALAVMTGAQFEGMGFAYGRVAVTESPREIAWGLPDGGRTDPASDGQIVDELIHEIGHTLFLDHAASQCFAQGMTAQQSRDCCKTSPNRDDVMSYCRARGMVNDDHHFYGFQECNLRNLKNKVVPAMLKGLAWNVPNREKCQ